MRLLTQLLSAWSLLCLIGEVKGQDEAPSEPVQDPEGVADAVEETEGEAPADAGTAQDAVETDASPAPEPPAAVPEPPAPAPKPTPKPPPEEPKKVAVPAKHRTARPLPPKRELATPQAPNFQSDDARQAAREEAERLLLKAKSAYEAGKLHQKDFRNLVLRYEGLGGNADLIAESKQQMLDNTKDMLAAALAHEGDAHMHDHMHRLSTAVDHAIAEGHVGPEVEAARKLRNTKIAEALDAAVKDMDISRWHTLVEHARTHAGEEMKTEIEKHELELILKAEALVMEHKRTTVEDRANLAAAIKVCELFELALEHLPEAKATQKAQEVRYQSKKILPGLVQANDYHSLVQHIEHADAHGVADTEVQEAKKHVVSMVKGWAAEAVKAHGTVEDEHPHIMNRGEIERTIKKMREQKFSEAEIQPVLAALQSRLTLNFKKKQNEESAVKLQSPDLIYWLSEYLSAATNPHLPESEQASNKAVVQAKVKALLGESSRSYRSSPQGMLTHASLVTYSSRPDIELDKSLVEAELVGYLPSVKEEFTASLGSLDLSRISSARLLAQALQGALENIPSSRDRDYDQLVDSLEKEENRLRKKAGFMAELETAMTHPNKKVAVKSLKSNMDRCRKHCGCTDLELQPYETQLRVLEREVSAEL